MKSYGGEKEWNQKNVRSRKYEKAKPVPCHAKGFCPRRIGLVEILILIEPKALFKVQK